jgi:hypothetical protein
MKLMTYLSGLREDKSDRLIEVPIGGLAEYTITIVETVVTYVALAEYEYNGRRFGLFVTTITLTQVLPLKGSGEPMRTITLFEMLQGVGGRIVYPAAERTLRGPGCRMTDFYLYDQPPIESWSLFRFSHDKMKKVISAYCARSD